MEIFYERTKKMLGQDSIDRLLSSHVAILGVGGVGSWAVESLVRTGVGEITLVDFDVIEYSNINRQIHALNSSVGKYKVDVMRNRLLDINPDLKVNIYKDKITADSKFDFLINVDYTIDCIDDVRAKVAVIGWHIAKNKKIVSSMGTGNKFGNEPFKIVDISKTKVCPLARAVRQRLKKEGIYSGVPVLYSEELPYKINSGKEKPGTICFSPAIAGLKLGAYVVEDIIK